MPHRLPVRPLAGALSANVFYKKQRTSATRIRKCPASAECSVCPTVKSHKIKGLDILNTCGTFGQYRRGARRLKITWKRLQIASLGKPLIILAAIIIISEIWALSVIIQRRRVAENALAQEKVLAASEAKAISAKRE